LAELITTMGIIIEWRVIVKSVEWKKARVVSLPYSPPVPFCAQIVKRLLTNTLVKHSLTLKKKGISNRGEVGLDRIKNRKPNDSNALFCFSRN